MQHLMIDLETLDTKSTAVILSIGAAVFDNSGLGTRFYEEIEIDDQLRHGRTVSGQTIAWWMAQSVEARKVFEGHRKPRLASILAKFSGLFPKETPTFVWGNGATFDNAILRHAYEGIGVKAPWGYREDRCFRTLKAMFPDVGPPEAPKVEHNALDDAVAQALHAQLLLCKLK